MFTADRGGSADVARRSNPGELGNTGYELFVGALSVLSLVNLVLISVLRQPAMQNVVHVLDVVLSIVFLIDFLVRLRPAPSRSDYLLRRFGWADLLASLPFPQVKLLRIFRLVRVIRLLRRYGVRNIGRSLTRDRAGSALLTLLLIGILVLEFGSLAMLHLERNAPDANITTAGDALWYVVVTMSTVGYGDQFPVSTVGRELGAFIIVIGVGIFGTLTGYLANLFLSPAKQPEAAETATTPDQARRQLHQIRELLAQQEAAIAELELALRET
ncbi:MAG: ion transporter [Jiangellaceae bacterium]